MRPARPLQPLFILALAGTLSLSACSDSNDNQPITTTPDAPPPPPPPDAPPPPPDTTALLKAKVDTIVVIYAENRSFDNLYGLFPGANGIPGKNPTATGTVQKQIDRDGSVLAHLPPVYSGLTATIPAAMTEMKPNDVFSFKDLYGIDTNVITTDLVHRFFNNQMQINGGKLDSYAAFSDAGGQVMGYYDGSAMAMWGVAQEFVLADNFFQGAFGGSYLNHQYLICACSPAYPDADTKAAANIAAVEDDGAG